jgi:hypothetical protein
VKIKTSGNSVTVGKHDVKAAQRSHMTSRCGLPERWTDLVVVAPDGTVVPLCPEVLGDDWATIRARLADIDRTSLPSLSDLMRDKDCDNVLNRAGDEVWTVERRRRTIRPLPCFAA